MSYKTKWLTKNNIASAISSYARTQKQADELLAAMNTAAFNEEFGFCWEDVFRAQGEHRFANSLDELLADLTPVRGGWR